MKTEIVLPTTEPLPTTFPRFAEYDGCLFWVREHLDGVYLVTCLRTPPKGRFYLKAGIQGQIGDALPITWYPVGTKVILEA